MEVNKKNLTICLMSYVLWGSLPAYWNLMIGMDPFFILCFRIIFALVCMAGLLVITRRMQVFVATLRDKATMRYLIPTSILITVNWGIYIWAVNTGHVLDSSLGYYMNPLVSFLFGILIFREKHTKLQLAAVALAFTGVLISVIAYGSVPYISISLTLTFAAYGVLKKKAHADPVSGIAVESLIITPFALIVALVFMTDSVRAVSFTDMLLLIGGGAASAIPLALYSRAVNDLPLIIVGFLQYISPSLQLVYALINGETLSTSRLVSFVFIGLGLIVFSVALVRTSKAERAVDTQML